MLYPVPRVQIQDATLLNDGGVMDVAADDAVYPPGPCRGGQYPFVLPDEAGHFLDTVLYRTGKGPPARPAQNPVDSAKEKIDPEEE